MGLRASGHQRRHATILCCPAYTCAQGAQTHQGGPTQQHLDWASMKRNMQKTPAQAAYGSATRVCIDDSVAGFIMLLLSLKFFRGNYFRRQLREA